MRIEIEATYRDLDAMGHVNNAVYFAYFEYARQKYWDRLVGLKSFRDVGFVVASASINYRQPVYMGDRLEMEIHCPRTGTTSFDFTYVLTRGGQVVAEGKTVQVLWDWHAGQRVQFTAELRQKIARLEAGP